MSKTDLTPLKSSAAEELRQALTARYGARFSAQILTEQQVTTPRGLATGHADLDGFLASGGFPCGELSILESNEGTGACTLWLESAARVTQSGRKVAWLENDFRLNPVSAFQRGVDLQHLYILGAQRESSSRQRLWILQELLSSKVFDLIGCDLGGARLPLRESRSLLAQVRRSGTALVILSRYSQSIPHEVASLVLSTHAGLHVLRAARRPVPQTMQRRSRHVDSIRGTLDPSLLLKTADSLPCFGAGA